LRQRAAAEAGGTDDVPSVREARLWRANLGTDRDWGFQAAPNPLLNGRRLPLSMGKVLGGGSSINLMIWARGHKNDWNHFAHETGDAGWSYESVLGIYRRIEDWRGTPDPLRRGKGGLVYVQPARDPRRSLRPYWRLPDPSAYPPSTTTTAQ
jgi:choline dehydrogenase